MVGQQCSASSQQSVHTPPQVNSSPAFFDGYVSHSSNVNRRVYLLGSILDWWYWWWWQWTRWWNADTSLRTIKITLYSVLYTGQGFFVCQETSWLKTKSSVTFWNSRMSCTMNLTLRVSPSWHTSIWTESWTKLTNTGLDVYGKP